MNHTTKAGDSGRSYELSSVHSVNGRQGICTEDGRFLLLYNRGARIVLGMPKGFYEGYTEEIHEVFVFDVLQ